MDYENALNFLLYSYFGIDGGVSQLKEKKEIIVSLCAHRAYLDLARTVKYKYTSTKLESMSSKKATDADQKEADLFQTAKTEVINKICDTILNAVDGDKIHCFFDSLYFFASSFLSSGEFFELILSNFVEVYLYFTVRAKSR